MIRIDTVKSIELFEAIKTEVRGGRVSDWEMDSDEDFTYANAQWRNHAWMRMQKTTSGLRVNIVGNQESPVDSETYAVYHARFVEMLVMYFDGLFEEASISALGTTSDLI